MDNEPKPYTSNTRVLIIDNDARYRKNLSELLSLLGYQVSAPEGSGDELIEAVINKAEHFRPHIAIVDLRLRFDWLNQPDGFELLGKLLHARKIIYSAYALAEDTRRAFRVYKVFDSINKSGHPDDLIMAVDSAAREVCATHRGLEFGDQVEDYRPEHIMQKLQPANLSEPGVNDLLNDLLARLFPEEKKLTLRPVESGAVTSHPIARGRTVIITVQREGKLEVEVVKLARAESIAQEVDNYYKYLHLNLGGHYCPSLGAHESFYELGGAVYTFLGRTYDDQKTSPMRTLAQAYMNNERANLMLPLEHYFKEVWGKLYKNKESYDITPYQAYDAFLGLTNRMKTLKAFMDQKPTIRIPGLNFSIPNPFVYIHENRESCERGQLLEFAVTHGDLHAGNLLIDDKCEHAWTIDFERTGYGPIYRDFVELEVDIAIRLVDAVNDNPRSFLELAAALCAPARTGESLRQTAKMKGETLRGINLIYSIRNLAEQVIGSFDPWEYIWGLLCDAVFAVCIEKVDSVRYNRALMLASAASLSLSNVGEFPPKDWKIGDFKPIQPKPSYII